MKSWQQSLKDSVLTGSIAAAAACAVVAWRGQRDSGSAIAPLNATSHMIWGNDAAKVEGFSWQHTVPGLLFNAGAGIWWGFIYHKLFGEQSDRHGLPAALVGGATTAALAYLVDYHLLPQRLSPGWELRISPGSMLLSLGALAAGLAVGASMPAQNR